MSQSRFIGKLRGEGQFTIKLLPIIKTVLKNNENRVIVRKF